MDASAAVLALEQHGFGKLVAHGAYTMNLCTADPDARAFASDILLDDLRRMAAVPGKYYNFHPGSHVGQGVEQGIEQIANRTGSVCAAAAMDVNGIIIFVGKGREDLPV